MLAWNEADVPTTPEALTVKAPSNDLGCKPRGTDDETDFNPYTSAPAPRLWKLSLPNVPVMLLLNKGKHLGQVVFVE
jgi:hypothetical protein